MLLFLFFSLLSSAVLAQEYQDGMKTGTVRVKFKRSIEAKLQQLNLNTTGAIVVSGIQAFDQVSAQLQAVQIKRVFPYAPKFEKRHRAHGLDLWFEITYSTEFSPLTAIEHYAAVAEVEKAEAVLEKRLIAGPTKVDWSKALTSEQVNDPMLADQWHYDNAGTLEDSQVGADINLDAAWEIQKGASNVIVSIVDGGIDVDHEDLADNMWHNVEEMNGQAGIDDDGNGYVDDIYGYNFVNNSGTIIAHAHGTHVSGTISAVNNNRIGVAGIAGGSGNDDGVRLMSSQIFNDNSSSTDMAAAIVYGADNGAVISQNSWGYRNPGYYEESVIEAIDYFIEEAGQYEGSPMKGGIVIFAAGNDNADGAYYPGYYDKTLTVASMGADYKRAYYSNYGPWVDITAPGGDQNKGSEYGVLSTLTHNRYTYMQGTSMACPHVSGIAALVVSEFGGPDFTNDALKERLLSSTRNIDAYNPDMADNLGAGYIDALMALQTDNGWAPSAVEDLALLGISQDFATLSWSAPADEDDGQAQIIEILYHTDSITNQNVDLAESEKMELRLDAGTLYTYELEGLNPETKFYFAIRSYDRWGNTSGLSNVVQGTTNEGPSINLNPTELSLTIDAMANPVGTTSFDLMNDANGVLKYTTLVRHKKHRLSYNSLNIQYPEVATLSASYQPTIDWMQLTEEATTEGVPNNEVAPFANFYDEIYYGRSGKFLIGESDLNLSNSSAVRYRVTQEAGFNLTDVQMFLRHNSAHGPMIMEIYEGAEMNKKNLVLVQEVTSYSPEEYEHQVTLDEFLYFEKGAIFWIAFHIPAQNRFPLGVTPAEDFSIDPGYNLMSFDMGKNWITMEEAVGSSKWVWSTVAKSKYQHLGNYITLTPSEGNMVGNTSEMVEVDVDASTLINGSYPANIVYYSNDAENKIHRLPISITVEGQKPVLQNANVIDFGSVFHGHEKEIVIPIQNVGYGNFNVKTTTSTDAQFFIVKKPRKIAARDEAEITILYTPDGVGNDNAQLQFVDKNGNEHSINLFGVGAAPAQISVTPLDQTIPDMAIGGSTTTAINIANTGAYPLEFLIPAFAQEGETIEGMPAVHRFGYSYQSNMGTDNSATYLYEDIAASGIDITDALLQINDKYHEIEIGFSFPFYGYELTNIQITNYGALTIDRNGSLFNSSPPSMKETTSPPGFISAVGKKLSLVNGGKIYYQRSAGKLIVQYENVELDGQYNVGKKMTFQIVLFYNGDIEYRFKDLSTWGSYNVKTNLVAVSDPLWKDGFIVHNKDNNHLKTNETIIRVVAPGQKLISAVSESYGIIAPGESRDIELSVSTDQVVEGQMFQSLAIVNNDPFNNPEFFKVNVNVSSGGVLDLALDQTTLDLGAVMQGGARRGVLSIANNGSKDTEISAVTLDNNLFHITADLPVTLKAKSAYYIFVDMVTDVKGSFEDVLTIETTDGSILKADIIGSVVPAPSILVDVASIDATVDAGSTIERTLTIQNNGEADLELVPAGNDWLHMDLVGMNAMELQPFTYYAMDSKSPEGPSFAWEDIRKSGTRVSWDYFMEENFWQELVLDSSVPFYGEEYDTLYIGWLGVISFDRPTHNEPEFPKAIPTDMAPNNFIAPYWAVQRWDVKHPDPSQVGVFYEEFEDRLVVQFSLLMDPFGMGTPYSYEAIIYKDGRIKYQYQTSVVSTTNMGVIGVENADGSDGVQVAAFQNYVEDGLAVTLTPAKKRTIAAGETLELNLVLDATYLNKGVHQSNFRLFNNTPQQEEVLVPVTLTVNGEAVLETPDAMEMGTLMAYEINEGYGDMPKPYLVEFTVENTGTDVIDFSSVRLKNAQEMKLERLVMNSSWGDYTWAQVPEAFNQWNQLMIGTGESETFRLHVSPTGLIPELMDTVYFESANLNNMVQKMPVHAMVTYPPNMRVQNDTVAVVANSRTHVETRTVTIDNAEGMSELKYDLRIDYFRASEPASVLPEYVPNAIGSFRMLDVKKLELNSVAPYDLTEYNTVLQYDSANAPTQGFGYGMDYSFSTATQFKAPETGFNLTHVSTWYDADTVLNSSVVVEIRTGGSSVANAKVLSTTSFEVSHSEAIDKGQVETFELEQSLVFYPGETFYVVFHYPIGVPYPQGAVHPLEEVPGRFLYYSGEGWFDLGSAGFGDHGFMVKAYEEVANTKSWVSIEGNMEGAVAVGDTVSLSLVFDAQDAQDIDNIAQLNVQSNDPFNTNKMVDLFLRKNQGPEFKLVEGSAAIKENELLEMAFVGRDVEGDAHTFQLEQAYDSVGLTVVSDTLYFTYKPDYDAQGEQLFVVLGEDEHGNMSNLEIEVSVENVNRAPMPLDFEMEGLSAGGKTSFVSIYDLFEDPDQDALSFVASSSDENILKLYSGTDELSLMPMGMGTVQLQVQVQDIHGATSEKVIDLTVGKILSTESGATGISVYPNPAKTSMHVQLTEGDNLKRIRVLNTIGKVMLESGAQEVLGKEHVLDVAALPAGVYWLEIWKKNDKTVVQFIKEN